MKKYIIGILLVFAVVAYAAEIITGDKTFKGTIEFDGVTNHDNTVNSTAQGEYRFQDAAGGQYVGLKAPATVGSSFALELPSADGSADQCIKTNGSNALSFGNCISSAGAVTVETKTASFTAVTSYAYLIDATLGNITATLPAASGVTGESITFYHIGGGNNLVLDGNASETIQLPGTGDVTTLTLSLDGDAITIMSDGTNWQTTSVNAAVVQVAVVESSGITGLTTNQDIDYDTENFDNYGAFNTANGTFTAPGAGVYYLCTGNAMTGIDTATNFSITITINGSSKVQAFASPYTSTTTVGYVNACLTWRMAKGDTSTVFALGDSNFGIDGSSRSWFNIVRIGL